MDKNISGLIITFNGMNNKPVLMTITLKGMVINIKVMINNTVIMINNLNVMTINLEVMVNNVKVMINNTGVMINNVRLMINTLTFPVIISLFLSDFSGFHPIYYKVCAPALKGVGMVNV